MIYFTQPLHNPPGQLLPSARQEAHVPSPPTHSTTTTVFSLVPSDPETSPFAAVVTSTGPMAKSNPFRFSTKWWDDETGLGWWGYRWYGESRWLSRDPAGERSGENLYGYAGNNSIGMVDFYGLTAGGITAESVDKMTTSPIRMTLPGKCGTLHVSLNIDADSMYNENFGKDQAGGGWRSPILGGIVSLPQPKNFVGVLIIFQWIGSQMATEAPCCCKKIQWKQSVISPGGGLRNDPIGGNYSPSCSGSTDDYPGYRTDPDSWFMMGRFITTLISTDTSGVEATEATVHWSYIARKLSGEFNPSKPYTVHWHVSGSVIAIVRD